MFVQQKAQVAVTQNIPYCDACGECLANKKYVTISESSGILGLGGAGKLKITVDAECLPDFIKKIEALAVQPKK